MNPLYDLADRIRLGQPVPFPIAALLTAATPIVRIGMARRLREPRERVNAHVISFGNITAGGAGKTTATLERTRRELAAGRRVAVLTRGYGTKSAIEPLAFDTAAGEMPGADAVGDEPALIARQRPGIVIIKGRDRTASAKLAVERYGCDVLILDDGFQYVRLERDENILLIDMMNPFGNAHLIPRGILREPLTHMARATEIYLTRCDQAQPFAPVLEMLARHAPGIPVRKTLHAPTGCWRVATGEFMPLEALRGKKVRAVCAIGNPEAFYRSLESAGAIITHRAHYRDHADIPERAFSEGEVIVTTEKDAIRLKQIPGNLIALSVELRFLE